jgi:glycyl-tRNA synthetase beta chain
VIQLTMRTNQKYFACVDKTGKLAPNFICTANIVAADGGAAIIAGNRKVLAARLSDAKFFWEQDLKVPLAEQATKLDQIVFHEKLGTVADKVDRVAKLARWLVEEGVVGNHTSAVTPAKAGVRQEASAGDPVDSRLRGNDEEKKKLADMAEQAARLAKADLVTGMVGEFPELQGVMGGYYAHAEGLPREVADAIRDHYKPVGQSDDVPTAPVTVAVSLADKLDSLQQFFAIGETPTGSKDPFALRRSALGIIRLLTSNGLRFSIPPKLLEFFADRLKVQQREAGVRHDLIDAVFALGGEGDLVRLLARVKALQAFVATEDGTNLLAGYKRAANILRKEAWTGPSSPTVIPAQGGIHQEASLDGEVDSRLRGNDEPRSSYTPEPAESALIEALDRVEPAAEAAVKDENFEGAMAALAALRGPIDAFFDSVTVNDVDPSKRDARLDLLARIRGAVHRVADFSKIEG